MSPLAGNRFRRLNLNLCRRIITENDTDGSDAVDGKGTDRIARQGSPSTNLKEKRIPPAGDARHDAMDAELGENVRNGNLLGVCRDVQSDLPSQDRTGGNSSTEKTATGTRLAAFMLAKYPGTL